MSNPADQTSRDAIIYDTNTSYFVEAGAGSGKTALLVERILTLLIDEGVPLSSIAAITFTVKAAEELTNRLRAAFTEIAEHGTFSRFGDEVRTFDHPQAKTRAEQALAALPGAAIETLHSFCLRLIRMYPLEAGVPPQITTVDEIETSFATVNRADAVIDLVDRIVSDDPTAQDALAELNLGIPFENIKESIAILTEQGLKTADIEKLVLFMDPLWGVLDATVAAPLPSIQFLTRADLESARREIQEWVDLAPGDVVEDKLFQVKVDPLIKELDRLIAEDKPNYDVPAALGLREGNAGNKTIWGVAPKTYRDRMKEIGAEFERKINSPIVRSISVLRRLIATIVRDNAQARRRTGKLEYHDMIFLADELVQIDYVRQELSENYRMVAVDEFQDTDGVQLRIVDAITAGKPGHRFTVGDPKQSIYRFRGANVNTYLSARQQAEKRGELLQLTANFRSDQEVVESVNAIFGEMFASVESDENDPTAPLTVPYAPMEASNSDSGFVAMLRRPEMNSGAGVPELCEHADIISAVKNAEVALSDIAVLVAKNETALGVQKALREHGIPAITEGAEKVYKDPEVEELIAVLRAIADPANGFVEVVALRGLYFGVSDQDLVESHRARRMGSEIAEDHPAIVAAEHLKKLRKRAASMNVAQIVEMVIDELFILGHLARPETVEKNPSIRRVLDDAHAFTNATNAGLSSFLRWAETQTEGFTGVSVPVLDDGTDAVRIMTIHASKGREFPVVILGGLTGEKDRTISHGLHPETGVVEFGLKGIGTDGLDEFKAFEKLATMGENVRKLYVAATRAKHQLIIPLEAKLTGGTPTKPATTYASTQGKYFYDSLNPDKDLIDPRELFSADAVALPHPRPQIDAERIRATYNKNAKDAEAEPPEMRLLTATYFAHAEETAQLAAIRQLGADEGWLTQTTESFFKTDREARGQTFGTVVHEVMDYFAKQGDRSDTDTVPETDTVLNVVTTVASINGLEPDLIDEASSIVETFLNSEIVHAAFAAPHYSEVPIIGTLADTAFEGVIDLLYQDETTGRWVIADYKTDSVVTTQRINEYFTQLQVYAHLLDMDVCRLELLFVDGGVVRCITRGPSD
ncbi:UvrD-helicase domain-containing protein [Corynebacterium aquatimens]|uniref:DNA 3'-5' helicase n=1 Tax=Corynebacterium aquatimens TaxID=1190508 RepID=A0A931E1U6_9CORY|nr:UvrD-helicase domain-containing protein [Corynebacterium aquatimens]MBG6122678.1 ATP-dependent exoDNAse (exonuclease V) beta subunit [Corynebacterium aquatimens]WJY64791.1 ATP-dependent helicase/nuclease subunit A [Corynebacterium aquatimens]